MRKEKLGRANSLAQGHSSGAGGGGAGQDSIQGYRPLEPAILVTWGVAG